LRVEGKSLDLKEEAEILRDGLASLAKRFQSQDKAIGDLYFGDDTSDFVNQGIEQAAADLKTLNQGIKATEQSLDELCKALNPPDWVKSYRPKVRESGKDFAKRYSMYC
jgi:hypothetical protein